MLQILLAISFSDMGIVDGDNQWEYTIHTNLTYNNIYVSLHADLGLDSCGCNVVCAAN